MKNLTINTATELKFFLKSSRKEVVEINGVSCSENYPMIEASNKHVSYYSVVNQDNVYLSAPFEVKTN